MTYYHSVVRLCFTATNIDKFYAGKDSCNVTLEAIIYKRNRIGLRVVTNEPNRLDRSVGSS
jgi:hypothetical protein